MFFCFLHQHRDLYNNQLSGTLPCSLSTVKTINVDSSVTKPTACQSNTSGSTSSSSSSSLPATSASSSSNNTGLIVGIVVGVLAFLAIAGFLYFYLYKSRKTKGHETTTDGPTPSDAFLVAKTTTCGWFFFIFPTHHMPLTHPTCSFNNIGMNPTK
jgi:hypothetical protein